MNEIRVEKAALVASLPPEWPADLLPEIQTALQASGRKVVVLDDDPTGTQTVYGLPVLTEWSVEQLSLELGKDFSAFYLLTNSRSLPETEAEALGKEIGHNLQEAARITGQDFVVASRGDSTLRGHFPAEVDALASGLHREFDATLVVPFFLEGGRFTANDIHYVAEGDQLIPVGQTEFAKDKAFGFSSSNLREWVVEKGGGRIKAENVHSITLEDIRQGGSARVRQQLLALRDQCVCVVNAMSMRDVQVLALGLLAAEAQGKRFIYRTSASLVQARVGLAPRSLLSPAELDLAGARGGLVMVGSYVPKTTKQLAQLLKETDISGIEISVDRLLETGTRLPEIVRVAEAVDRTVESGRDVVVYTSRTLIAGSDAQSSLAIGNYVSAGLVEILRTISVRPRYLVAKGGITSSDLATKGLNVKRAMVLGQVLPGVPVWKLGAESLYPGLVYVVFPGNVGSEQALAQVVNDWSVAALQ